ncbi:phosphatidylinositol transfer protein SFH5 [Kluyveromyces marxianus]|uniref:Phosphatidylinositol transfer protein SFH5 n=2 Tax=Kluyveromyces marxianus TaxID=4911 RepID=W0T7A6_KLUMD|nr:phosphatidylinositol transfer protein SFH5 [Kluyveromyces marxianus DMKU3-1042]QGN13864.1 phosphatidylinositol transfer protein SFH5 [Kluyveromyces marxianus]BAO37979.1 phosphatidylinositol transfer protein SFH5 [Kluyveromyces marxianus DMKU3-1042]
MALNFENDEQKKCYETLRKEIESIVKEVEYDELYGQKLTPDDQFYKEGVVDRLVFKFCKANQFQLEGSRAQLKKTLKWRKEFRPLHAAFKETPASSILDEVCAVTNSDKNDANKKVITWNLYGLLVKHKEVFKDLDGFMRFRIGLMERGLQLLDFESDDNHLMTQIHDYSNVSMWRLDADIKKCSRAVIETFQQYYPETLYAKFFVNVPYVMSWLYEVIKMFVSEDTRKKFVVMSDGHQLKDHLAVVPKEFGGEEPLKSLSIANVEPNAYVKYLLDKDSE